jgi:nucleoside-diphosphate-sugar epimerase
MLFVLGHSGFIGGALYSLARSRGLEVIGASSKEVDLRDLFAVKCFFESIPTPASVVMCAIHSQHLSNDVTCIAENVAMVRNVVDAGNGKIASLIYLSSIDVYGFEPILPIAESNEVNPQAFYGLSKLAAEYALFFNKVSYPITIFRLSGVYGAGDKFRSIIGLFYRQIMESGKISLFNNVLRDYVYVDDACDLILECAQNPRPGLFNVATGRSFPLESIARLVGEASRANPEIVFERAGAGKTRARDLTFDTAYLREVFPNWHPQNLAEGISSFLAEETRISV